MDSLSQFPMRLYTTDAPTIMKWQSARSLDASTRSLKKERSPTRRRNSSGDRQPHQDESELDEDSILRATDFNSNNNEQATFRRRRPLLQYSDKSASTSRLITQMEQQPHQQQSFQPSDDTVHRVVQKYKKRLGKCEKQVQSMKEETETLKKDNKKQQSIMGALSQDYRRIEEQLKDSRERESTSGAMVLQLRVLCETYESQINKLQKECARKTERLDKERESVRSLRAEVEELKRENMRLKVEKMNRSIHVSQLARDNKSDTGTITLRGITK